MRKITAGNILNYMNNQCKENRHFQAKGRSINSSSLNSTSSFPKLVAIVVANFNSKKIFAISYGE